MDHLHDLHEEQGPTTPYPGPGGKGRDCSRKDPARVPPPLRILILEDEILVARHLAQEIRDLGHCPLGPFSCVDDAILSDLRPDAAILDICVGPERSFALATEFQRRAIPFLFYSGYERAILPEHLKAARLFRKPSPTAALVAYLRRQAQPSRPEPTVLELLPILRHRARELVHDPLAADRLLEAVLIAATRGVGERPETLDLEEWLLERLHREYLRRGRDHLI